MNKTPCALIMAGGTGGHIFPGLAVAEALRERGWRVHWLGAPGSVESRLVPPRGFPLELVDFGGGRGKGVKTLFLLPLRLLRAFWQALQVVRRVQPDVLVGLGGYITFPGGMMGTLRLLVVGGSLGAKALNDTVPQALALIPSAQRPQVIHQSGEKQIEALRANYTAAGVLAELTPFIDDTAQAFADADLIVCRAGASTVTEIAAVGAAALFVPFPSAVDDHQTTNARFLVDAGAAWLVPQNELTPLQLAQTLQTVRRETLMEMANKAKTMEKTEAVAAVVSACETLAKVGQP